MKKKKKCNKKYLLICLLNVYLKKTRKIYNEKLVSLNALYTNATLAAKPL